MKPHARKSSRRNRANTIARAEKRSAAPPAASKYARKIAARLERARSQEQDQ